MNVQTTDKAAFQGSRLPRRRVHETLSNHADRAGKGARPRYVRYEDDAAAQDFLDRESYFSSIRFEGGAA